MIAAAWCIISVKATTSGYASPNLRRYSRACSMEHARRAANPRADIPFTIPRIVCLRWLRSVLSRGGRPSIRLAAVV